VKVAIEEKVPNSTKDAKARLHSVNALQPQADETGFIIQAGMRFGTIELWSRNL